MSENTGGGGNTPVSIPRYLWKHSGVAIVAGSADTLPDDMEKAQRLFPDADVFGVNKASQHVHCSHIVSVYRDLIASYRHGHVSRFGQVTTHCFTPGGDKTHEDFPAVDYWWPNLNTGGTSGWLAAKVAVAIGYERVILCGVPIEKRPHFDGEMLYSWADDYHVEQTRKSILACEEMKPFVRSMSGWTREVFGEP